MRNLASIVSAGLIGGYTVLAGASCSSTSPVTANQAASDVASALTTQLDTCAPLYVQIAYGDLAKGESRTSSLIAEALGATGSGWTPSAVEACAQAIKGISCDDALGHDLPGACRPPAGQLATGAACGDNAQCVSGYCNLGAGGKCGTCAGALGAAGAVCYRDDDCVFGTKCVGADVTASPAQQGKCVAPGASGATCDAAHPCKVSLSCKGGTCGQPDAPGASCSTGTCDGPGGYYCSKAANGVCTKAALASAGQTCGLVNSVFTLCTAGGICDRGNNATGTCVAPAADFATCDAQKGPGCMQPATCIAGVCTRPTPATCH